MSLKKRDMARRVASLTSLGVSYSTIPHPFDRPVGACRIGDHNLLVSASQRRHIVHRRHLRLSSIITLAYTTLPQPLK